MNINVNYIESSTTYRVAYRLKRGTLFGDYLETYLEAIV